MYNPNIARCCGAGIQAAIIIKIKLTTAYKKIFKYYYKPTPKPHPPSEEGALKAVLIDLKHKFFKILLLAKKK
ncbi:MAG: hypothetical protein ACKPH9_04800, partial [Dolichospermum sp.]